MSDPKKGQRRLLALQWARDEVTMYSTKMATAFSGVYVLKDWFCRKVVRD